MNQTKIAYNKIQKVKQKFLNKEQVSYSSISRALNQEFKRQSVRFKFGFDVNKDQAIFADYNAKDLEGMRYNIDVNIFKDDINNDKFYDELFLAVVHEYRHGYQARKRKHRHMSVNLDKEKNKSYATDYFLEKDELDAYAFEASVALGMNINNRWVMNKYKSEIEPVSPKSYKRFLKKIFKNLYNK